MLEWFSEDVKERKIFFWSCWFGVSLGGLIAVVQNLGIW